MSGSSPTDPELCVRAHKRFAVTKVRLQSDLTGIGVGLIRRPGPLDQDVEPHD